MSRARRRDKRLSPTEWESCEDMARHVEREVEQRLCGLEWDVVLSVDVSIGAAEHQNAITHESWDVVRVRLELNEYDEVFDHPDPVGIVSAHVVDIAHSMDRLSQLPVRIDPDSKTRSRTHEIPVDDDPRQRGGRR